MELILFTTQIVILAAVSWLIYDRIRQKRQQIIAVQKFNVRAKEFQDKFTDDAMRRFREGLITSGSKKQGR